MEAILLKFVPNKGPANIICNYAKYEYKYYLSIDEATKTFGYIICKMRDIDDIINTYDKILYVKDKCISKPDVENIQLLTSLVDNLEHMLNTMIVVYHCNTIDLIPDKKDTEISTLERVRALKKFIQLNIIPQLTKLEQSEIDRRNINTVLEFQMGYNNKTRVISDALCYEFAETNIIFIPAVYKNKYHIPGKDFTYLSYWQGNYKTSYLANKAHAKACFKYIAELFRINISGISNDKLSHVADAFMQIFGIYLAERSNEIMPTVL